MNDTLFYLQIFHTLKAPIDKYYATVLLGGVEIIGTVFCVLLIHYTGKRPLVLISTVGVGLGFFGTATYANFLDSIPGITVDNIVANVSSLDLNKANLITALNVPQLLENSFLQKFENESQPSNDTFGDYEDSRSHIMKVRDVSNGDKQEYMIPLSIYDDFNSTNFDFELLNSGIDETESPLMVNMTIDQDNRTTELNEFINEVHNLIPDDLVIQIPKVEENRLLWLPLSLLLMSAFFAHMGIKLIPWMLIGEVFPASVRSGASGISGGTGYLFGFLANKLFLKMLATMTLPGTFWFYSSVAFVGAIVLYFVLPETEGRSLVEIEQHFSGGLELNKDSNAIAGTEAIAQHITVVPATRTDVVIGIPTIYTTSSDHELHDNDRHKVRIDLKNWESDRIFQRHLGEHKNECLHQVHQPHHHPLYTQNPRAYMRTNNRIRTGGNNDIIVFSTHL